MLRERAKGGIVLSVEDFEEWLGRAEPGDELIYYKAGRLPVPEYAMSRYIAIMARTYKAFIDRQVILLKRRATEADGSKFLAYTARKASPQAPDSLFLGKRVR